jgi:hypothetical protein
MTTPEPLDDDALDRQVKAAAAVPFDDVRVTEAVLARVHRERRVRPERQTNTWTGWIGPAAFASILVATPFAVALYPASEDALLVGLATGDPLAILGRADEAPLTGFEAVFE